MGIDLTEVDGSSLNTSFFKSKSFKTFQIIILLGLLVYLGWTIPLDQVLSVIQTINPLLLAAGVLVGLMKTFIRAGRLSYLTHILGLKISVWKMFRINLGVKFYLLFLPAAMIGSGIRWVKVSPQGKSAETLAAVAFNRLIETYFSVAAGIFWYFIGRGIQNTEFWILLIFILGIGVFWLMFIGVTKVIASWVGSKEAPDQKPIWKRAWLYLKRIVDSIHQYTDNRSSQWGILFGMTVFPHLVGLLSYLLVALSAGIQISFPNLAWTQSLIQLAAMTPISIAGGLGLREVSLVLVLPQYGVARETALAFSMLLLFRNLVLSLLGGGFELGELIFNPKRTAEEELD